MITFRKPNNTFDGIEARSYEWHVYALVRGDKIYVTETAYSNTTRRHMHCFLKANEYPEVTRIKAPMGLGDLSRAAGAIQAEINELRNELSNPRNRARQRRIDRIAALERQLVIVSELTANT